MGLFRQNGKLFAGRRGLGSVLGVILAICTTTLPALAQSPDCERVRGQIAALDQGGGGRSNAYGAAAQKQQGELERTSAYAHSLGCDQSFFFGAPPAQCGALNARIRAMQANLSQLQGMAARSGGGSSGQRQNLVAWYNSYCRSQPRGFFDQLFGGGGSQPQPEEAPPEPVPSDEDQPARGGSQAICVRTCDGGFFPLNYSARRGNLDSLEDLCKALCPNAEVALFTRNPSNDVGTAVGADGTPYRDLPNAFKFTKSFDQSCTCKPPGVSWVQALTQSDAEHVLGQERKGDIIVTPEKSLELSRPKADSARSKGQMADPARVASDKPQSAGKPAGPNAPPPPPAGPATDADDPDTAQIIGADGVKRRVRIVGPTP